MLSFLMIMYYIYHQEIKSMEYYVLNNLVPVHLNGSVFFDNVRAVQSIMFLIMNQVI